jgi:2-polyprenyl-3-methyl-5-hydroxy-6-metoxy-1,4-benzoquinol methylase
MPDTNLDTCTSASKLSREQEHLLALQSMQTLETYYRWSYDLFKPFIGRRILDAGCGLGNFTAIITKKNAEYILAVDSSPRNIQVLKDRFKDLAIVEIAQVDLETDNDFFRGKQIDTIVCLDMLEHVYDDIALLKSFFKIMQTGGHLLVKVPTCKWLYGSIDLTSGHYRRYTPEELRVKAESVGWETIKANYMNIAGVIPYWVKSCVLKKGVTFSRTFRPWQLKVVGGMVPILKILDKIIGPPIGQSAVLIARKPKKA